MDLVFQAAAVYLLFISAVSIFLTVGDKRRAVKNKWRVPESTLLLCAALGGSLAMYITMRCIRHKTKHKKFMVGIPVILVLQAAFLFWLFLTFGKAL